MKYFFLLLLTFFYTSYSHSSDFIKEEGSFISMEGDSGLFIKEQLIHNAFEKVITTELKNMGLDQESFWESFRERFDIEAKKIEEKLGKQFNITDQSEPERLDSYKKTLREKTLSARKKFGNIERVITSYSVNEVSKSQENPDLKFISLQAKVDRKELRKLYFNYSSKLSKQKYDTLYLLPIIHVEKFSYLEIGVDKEQDFTNAIISNWLIWLKNNKPSYVDKVEVLTGSILNHYENSNLAPELSNSLVLKLELNIIKKSFEPTLKEYTLVYSGNSYLHDIGTNKFLTSANFQPREEFYYGVELSSLPSKVANSAYRLPFAEFQKVVNSIKGGHPNLVTESLVLTSFKNLDQVLALMEQVENRGLKYSMSSKLKKINKDEFLVEVSFEGDKKDLISLLNSFKSGKNSFFYEVLDSGSDIKVKYKENL